VAKRYPSYSSSANASNKLPNRRANLFRRILLNKVNDRNRDFPPVRPTPAEVAHAPDDLAAGIGIEEELRQTACGEPVAPQVTAWGIP
jgi:hypothetical protein